MQHDNDNRSTKRNYGASPHTGRPLQAIRKLAKEDWRSALALYLEIQQAPATEMHNEDAAAAAKGDDVQAADAPAEELTFETLAETPYSAAKNEGARGETTTAERPSERDLFTNIGWIEWPWCGRPWLMSRATMGLIRKAADASTTRSGIWADSLANGQPATLLGRPVYEAPGLDTWGTTATGRLPSALFGDVASAYQIVDRVPGIDILKDEYTSASTGIVNFWARRRVGGSIVQPEAIVALNAA